jgi:AraC-like DNA-binding protein
LKLNLLADKLQITSHQLSEYINTQTGKTYQNWLNGYRIEHACSLLIEKPEWAIIRIAFESGFSSKSSFQDAFKKEMGITPSEYRKSR